MPAPKLRFVFFSALSSLCLAGSTSFAAQPRDEVLRLVPDDVGICILIQDLRGQAERLHKSPFAERLAASPVGRALRDAPELKQLAAFDEHLRAHLQMSWAQLRDDVLGDAIALAYTPGPPGKPEQEQGLLLLHARKPERLAAIITRLNELQKQSGEISDLESRQFAGHTYQRRKKKDGEEFYCLLGPLLVFSDSEPRLQRALECDGTRPPADREPPPQLRRLQALGVEQDLFAFCVNPRVFDAALKHKLESAQGADASVLRTFGSCWDALDGLAMTVRLKQDLSLALVMQVRPDALPPAVRFTFDEARKPTVVWTAFPEKALFTAAGRVSWQTGRNKLSAPERKAGQDLMARSIDAILGRDLLPELFGHVGPEWGVCVAPPELAPGESSGPIWVPSFTAVIQLRSGGAPPIEKRVLAGLDVVVRLSLAGINSQHGTRIRLKKVAQGPVDVRIIDVASFLPSGFQPAIDWQDG